MNEEVIQFKNAPLVEAVFEIRFLPELSIENNRDKFYNKIKGVFPRLLIPKIVPGEAPQLQLYRFDSEDGVKTIRNSINSFAYSTNEYTVFTEFQKEALRYLSLFCSIFGIKKLNRTGLRYINHIPADESYLLSDYLNVELQTPGIDSKELDKFRYEFSTKLGEGAIRVLIQSETISIEKPPITAGIPEEILSKLTKFKANKIILDFDYYIEQANMTVNKIEDYLEKSHKHTKSLFLSLITDKYHESLEEVKYGIS